MQYGVDFNDRYHPGVQHLGSFNTEKEAHEAVKKQWHNEMEQEDLPPSYTLYGIKELETVDMDEDGEAYREWESWLKKREYEAAKRRKEQEKEYRYKQYQNLKKEFEG